MRVSLLAALCVSAFALAGAAKPARPKAKGSPTPRHSPVARASRTPTPAPTPDGARMLALTSGAIAVPLDLSLEIRAEAAKPEASPVATPEKLRWKEEDGVWVGHARGALWQAVLTLTPSNGEIAFDADVAFDAPVEVEKAAVRLRIPGGASAVTRTLVWKGVEGIERVDTGTPILVSSSALGIAGGAGFVGARYLPGHWRSGSFVDVELILDDAAAHPFSTYDECLEKLPTDENDPNAVVNWTDLEKRTARDQRTLAAGEGFHGHATLLMRDGAPSPPLIVERWPAGYRAALVFTDHADRTDPAALRAVLYGTSDEKSDDYGKKGFFGHGLSLTKTFFVHGSRVGCLENDASARALADEIVAHGSEVGSHSITSIVDTRDAVKKGLPTFAPWHAVTWIDHEPYTNCEAISNLGWKNAAPYGIRDLLVDADYRWVWAATDLPGSRDAKLINLFGGPPSEAAPAYFPLPMEPRLDVFRSVWFYAPPATLDRALDDKALDAFTATRGLFVGHTYLSASLATTKSDAHKADLVVKKNAKTGALEIDGKLDQALARLETRQKAGALLTLPWRDAGDRLVSLTHLSISWREDGSALIRNDGKTDIAGLTIAVPAEVDLAVEGSTAAPTRHEPGRSTTWFDVPAGTTGVVVRASRAGSPVPLLGTRRVTLVPR